MTIDDIREWMLSKIEGVDYTALTGATDADGRLYYVDDAPAEFDVSRPLYVTYSLLNVPEPRSGVMEAVFALTLWAHRERYQNLRNLRDLLVGVFDRITWPVTVDPDSGTLTEDDEDARDEQIVTRIIREQDVGRPGQSMLGRSLHLRVGWVQPV